MLMITKGMQVWIIDSVAETPAVVEVKRVTAVNFGTSPADDIETTDLEQDEYRQYEKGLKSPSAATLSILYDTEEPSHALLKALEESGSTNPTMVAIGARDGTAPPTVTDGEFVFPDTRTFMAINGYVSDFPIDIQLNATVPVPVAFRRSLGLIISRKTP